MGAAFVQARSESEPDNYLHRKFGTLRAKSHTVDETDYPETKQQSKAWGGSGKPTSKKVKHFFRRIRLRQVF